MDVLNTNNPTPTNTNGVFPDVDVRCSALRAENAVFISNVDFNGYTLENVGAITGVAGSYYRWIKSQNVPPLSGEMSFSSNVFYIPNPQPINISKTASDGTDVSNFVGDLTKIIVNDFTSAESYICVLSGKVDNGTYYTYSSNVIDIIGAGTTMPDGDHIEISAIDNSGSAGSSTKIAYVPDTNGATEPVPTAKVSPDATMPNTGSYAPIKWNMSRIPMGSSTLLSIVNDGVNNASARIKNISGFTKDVSVEYGFYITEIPVNTEVWIALKIIGGSISDKSVFHLPPSNMVRRGILGIVESIISMADNEEVEAFYYHNSGATLNVENSKFFGSV